MSAILPLCAALLLLACGDDEGPGRPRYRVEIDGVDVRAPIGDLSSRERESLCHSFDGYVDTHIDLEAVAYIACLPQALVLGGSESGCEQRLDECVALAPDPIEVRAEAQVQEVCLSHLTSCQASVAELEGCINLNLDLLFEILEDWSCALYGDPQVEQQAQRMMNVVNVCAELDAACNRAAHPFAPD